VVQTEDGDLELGDIIVAIDGEKISNNDDLFKTLDKHKLGDTVSLEVNRQGRRMTVPVRLTDVPAPTQRRNGRE
jgi:S1-C subfamily serine protease